MDQRRKALGRGLGALIPGAPRQVSTIEDDTTDQTRLLPLAAIVPSPLQPRQDFPEETLVNLAISIKQNGVLQPLVVRRRDGGTYELIAGERRFRAAQRAGIERVPVVLREATDREALELALIENVQREDLNPLDEASAYRRLMAEFGLTQEEIALRVAKSRSAVANTLRVLTLPPAVQAEIRAGRLSGGHARAIAGATGPDTQLAAAREVARQRLNVRETEKLVRELSAKGTDADRAAVEDRLRRALGTKVRLVTRGGGKGRIEIDFFSLDELQGLIDRLAPA
jgi:ParB family chromosome partitioning protein